jgi:hypothetical protein
MKRAVGFHRDLFVSEPQTDRHQTDSSQEACLRHSLTACKLSFFLSPFGKDNREEETHTLHCCSCRFSCTVLLLHLVLGKSTSLVVVVVVVA